MQFFCLSFMWKVGGMGNFSGPVRTKIKFFPWLLIYNHMYGIASISGTWLQRNMRTATRYNNPPPPPHLCMSICRTQWNKENLILTHLVFLIVLLSCIGQWGARSGAVDWGTALQATRPWVRFPLVSSGFIIDIILPAALWPWGWFSL